MAVVPSTEKLWQAYYAGGTDVAVADGGTGLSSGTSGGVLGFTAAGTLASSAALTAKALVVGGGAGATPTTIAALTDGQLAIGSTGNNPVPATITAGTGVTVTNAAGSITIASDGGAGSSGRCYPMNGSMSIWQGANSFAAAASGTYIADNWLYSKSGAAVHTVSRSTDVPTVAEAGIKFLYSLLLDCTTVDAAIAAGDYVVIGSFVEGYDWNHLAQRALTLRFWVKSTKTGTFCVALQNAAPDRTLVAEYTVSVADTWEFKTVTLIASTTTGTWDYTNDIGIVLIFALSCGSTYQTTTGAWQTGGFYGTSNQVNATDSTSNNFYLTGVDIRPSDEAYSPSVPPFAQELAWAQRYYSKTFDYGTAAAQATGSYAGATAVRSQAAVGSSCTAFFPVTMRTAPTLTTYNPTQADANWRNTGDTASGTFTTLVAATASSAVLNNSTATAGVWHIHWQADARF